MRSTLSLAITFIVCSVVFAPSAGNSGQFMLTQVTQVGQTEVSDYGDSALMGTYSMAQFEGSVDMDDDNWQIAAGIRPASGQWHDGTPKTGANNIYEGMIINCSSSSCGGSAQVDKCTSSNTNNAFTYKGSAATSHNRTGAEIDSRTKIGSMTCPGADTPPTGGDPLEDGCTPVP